MSNFRKLSIVIPVYNEANTIGQVLDSVNKVEVGLEKEIIVVDDGSHDGTREVLKGLDERYRIFLLDKNRGKGVALRTGFGYASGDIVIVQDADLEYDPTDYPLLIEPILQNKADVVFGSRFLGHKPHRVLYNSHFIANKFLTFLSNLFTGLNLSDMETGYKVFTKNAIDSIHPHLKSKRFGIEPELTALVAKFNFRVYEVGISYNGRTYEDGKKITWRDGLAAVWHIIRFNLFKRK